MRYERPLKLIHHELKDINTDTLNKTDTNCFRKIIYLADEKNYQQDHVIFKMCTKYWIH
jgi:hypothetical protein